MHSKTNLRMGPCVMERLKIFDVLFRQLSWLTKLLLINNIAIINN